jgi:glycosyltransferase involved in cell wall biosynthesis
MLSVIIETKNHAEDLARTLASLVPAAVEGVVRDVTVRDHGSSDETRKVCEHAGVRWLEIGDIGHAVKQTRSDWILLLSPGARLMDGWMEPVAIHMQKQTQPARFSRSRAHRLGFLARIGRSQNALAEGLLISKRQALALARSGMNGEALARGLSAQRLAAEIAPPV